MFVAMLRMLPGDSWLIVLYAAGAISAFAMWRLMPWVDRASQVVSIGAVLLLTLALNHLLYLADFVLSGSQLHLWPLNPSAPENALIAGEAMTVLGTFLTTLAWRWFGGMRVSPVSLFGEGATGFRVLCVAYVMSLAVVVLSSIGQQFGDRLGRLLPSLQVIGLLCCYLLPVKIVRNAAMRLALVVLMSAPFLASALGTGMKEAIIVSVLPIAVTAWQGMRSWVTRVTLIALGIAIFSFVGSYVNFYRANYWKTNTEVATQHALTSYIADASEGGVSDAAKSGGAFFLARNNASWYHGWAVSIANDIGLYPDLVFEPMVTVFVPRFMWPDKPRNIQGAEYTALVTGQAFVYEQGSSTATGFYTGLYLGGGWIAVLAGAILSGGVLAGMTRILFWLGGSLAGGLYMAAILPFTLRMSEEWPVSGLALPIITGCYVLALSFIFKIAAKFVLRSEVSTR